MGQMVSRIHAALAPAPALHKLTGTSVASLAFSWKHPVFLGDPWRSRMHFLLLIMQTEITVMRILYDGQGKGLYLDLKFILIPLKII